MKKITRRGFLDTAVAALGAGAVASFGCGALEVVSVDNPLAGYPDRDWEKLYRDQYRYDRTFTWVCAPNDTHMCRLRAFVRNGVVVRSEQNYDHQDYTDLYGNRATPAWNPRACPKGYTFQRRVYGPYRLKGPVIRKGWKDWAGAGFPSLSGNPQLRGQYKFDGSGNVFRSCREGEREGVVPDRPPIPPWSCVGSLAGCVGTTTCAAAVQFPQARAGL